MPSRAGAHHGGPRRCAPPRRATRGRMAPGTGNRHGRARRQGRRRRRDPEVAVKFGTLVTVLRGGGAPKGTPGCLRRVPGVLVGARGCNRLVRLTADDPLDTVGWS